VDVLDIYDEAFVVTAVVTGGCADLSTSTGTVDSTRRRWETPGVNRLRVFLPWAIAAVTVGVVAFALVLDALAGDHGDPWWQWALAVGAVLLSAAFGLLITVLLRGHPIGWLLLANALLLATSGVAVGYAQYAVLEDPGALPGPEWAVLWDQSAWSLLFGVILAIVLLFPDGRLPSPRARWVAICGAAAVAGFAVLSVFDPEPFEAPYEAVDRPLPALPDALGALWPIVLLGVLASLVGGVIAVWRRFRAATGIERLQLRWLVISAGLVPLTLIVCLVGAAVVGGVEDDGAFSALFLFMLGAIPASIGVAVLRYRLYAIDRLINRTLVYGVLTLLLAAAYGATALVLGTALGSGSDWATAGATLAAAVVFRPLRTRVQDVVDRSFSRARYDARRRIVEFLEDLRAGRARPEAIEPILAEVLSDPVLKLRFWLPEGEIYVDARGRPVDDSHDERQRTEVQRAGVPLGMVLHSPPSFERPGLLEEVVADAGLAIEIARLGVELRRQLEEVEASRGRIVAAGNAERRRIERDLHDGAQARLVSIGLALRHAQHELDPASGTATAALDGALDEITLAIEELRDLARGVRPAQLDDGLLPALRELAGRAPIPVAVKAGAERFPVDVEAAAFFIASEGLTNAIKHARASRISLSAERQSGALVVVVSDDGVGGACEADGTGLRGLSDRVEAHRGALRLESEPDCGTTLIAELPCG
jgi:signal transduction histidine kinase